uniref:KTSC domain-containing protein n=1 Tax=Desmonostoc muscorum LEGE 12446 TaxID=1828758 RepID=A0A8J7D5S9_DESMC
MKTNYTKGIACNLKISLWLISIFFSVTIQAQEDEEVQDTTKTGYSVGRVELKNPPSIIEAYTYDPITNRYIYTNTVNGFNINYPVVLTPEEYEELVLRESMRKYFKEKSDAIDGK